MSFVIDPKPCPVCGEPFTPVPNRRGKVTEACPAHIRKFNARQMDRRDITALAVAAIKRKAAARVDRVLANSFGALTDRDREIFEAGRKLGYSDGYNKGYARHL